MSCVIASDSTGIDHLSNIYYYDSFGEQKEGVSCDMNSRLGYINKEKDYESGLHDHGVRKYDDLSGRFISVDPLWSKYIGWTPYHYCENDPVNAEDGNGMDYDKEIGQNKITVSATFYTNSESFDYLQNAINEIQKYSGKENYMGLPIYFNLHPIKSDNPLGDFNFSHSQFDYNGNEKTASTNTNIFMLLDASDKLPPDIQMEKNTEGACATNRIFVKSTQKDDLSVGIHEILHALGLLHSLCGVMTECTCDPQHSLFLSPDQIINIITNANHQSSPGIGKGTTKIQEKDN